MRLAGDPRRARENCPFQSGPDVCEPARPGRGARRHSSSTLRRNSFPPRRRENLRLNTFSTINILAHRYGIRHKHSRGAHLPPLTRRLLPRRRTLSPPLVPRRNPQPRREPSRGDADRRSSRRCPPLLPPRCELPGWNEPAERASTRYHEQASATREVSSPPRVRARLGTLTGEREGA